MEEMYGKDQEVRELIEAEDLDVDVQVDGGINDETMETVLTAGANLLVAGSYVFNDDLTKAGAESANYPFCTIDPNVGVVPVPDERLDVLAEMNHSAKVVPAVIEFVDIAGLVRTFEMAVTLYMGLLFGFLAAAVFIFAGLPKRHSGRVPILRVLEYFWDRLGRWGNFF